VQQNNSSLWQTQSGTGSKWMDHAQITVKRFHFTSTYFYEFYVWGQKKFEI
jgi:hypothetical protein